MILNEWIMWWRWWMMRKRGSMCDYRSMLIIRCCCWCRCNQAGNRAILPEPGLDGENEWMNEVIGWYFQSNCIHALNLPLFASLFNLFMHCSHLLPCAMDLDWAKNMKNCGVIGPGLGIIRLLEWAKFCLCFAFLLSLSACFRILAIVFQFKLGGM